MLYVGWARSVVALVGAVAVCAFRVGGACNAFWVFIFRTNEALALVPAEFLGVAYFEAVKAHPDAVDKRFQFESSTPQDYMFGKQLVSKENADRFGIDELLSVGPKYAFRDPVRVERV